MRYKTKHLVTYTGGGEGGYVYFYKERRPGWYRWNRNWGREATHTYIDDGVVAVTRVGQEVEYMGVLPMDYDPYDWRRRQLALLIPDDPVAKGMDRQMPRPVLQQPFVLCSPVLARSLLDDPFRRLVLLELASVGVVLPRLREEHGW